MTEPANQIASRQLMLATVFVGIVLLVFASGYWLGKTIAHAQNARDANATAAGN